MPSAAALETDVGRLKRQREALGSVNLRAEEDAREVQEEHDTLVSEKADLEEAIRALRSGIASLNREGRERLLTAFEQVNANFGMLFKHLFGGGEANLVLVESDDPLEAGLEIMKKVGLKKVGMELGSNTPVIVCADCDLEQAVENTVSGAFWAAGQNCIGVQRIYVQEGVFTRFRDAFVERTLLYRVGPKLEEAGRSPHRERLLRSDD
mgnify:CR=1 FL=1